MIDVQYKKKYLEKCYRTEKEAIRRWGPIVGPKYHRQLALVYASDTIDDLYTIPQLDFHPLTGDRKGQYAIKLTSRARIIALIKGNTILIIEEVNTDHYE